MIYPVYCVRDNKVGFQPQLLLEHSNESAKRGFAYAINNEGLMNYSPKDFDLYKVGTFDTEKGKIESCVPEIITQGFAVIGEKE